jgi:signal transduction histidine kinase
VIKGLKLGADDYLIKPYDKEEVRARIQKVLKGIESSEIDPKELLFQETSLFNFQICHMAALNRQNDSYKKIMNNCLSESSNVSFYVQYVDIIEELMSKKMIMISKDYKNNKSTLDRLYKLQEARSERAVIPEYEISKQIKDQESEDRLLKTFQKGISLYEEELKLLPYLSFIFEDKNLNIDLKTNDEGLSIPCNKIILKQILFTLLENIMIHDGQSDDPIPVVIDRTSDRIILAVRNRISGIEDSEKKRLFTQGYSSRGRAGMGLAAARYLAHNYMKGDVKLTGSEPAEFSLIIPG